MTLTIELTLDEELRLRALALEKGPDEAGVVILAQPYMR